MAEVSGHIGKSKSNLLYRKGPKLVSHGHVDQRLQLVRHANRGGPQTNRLDGSDYATDREWHVTTKWCASGWANDPSQWSQYSKRAKPTYSDPSNPDGYLSVQIEL